MIFEQGDIIEFDLSPSVGHEPQGLRPAMVVSSFEFNTTTSMTLVCPITSRNNNFPLHFPLPDELDTIGCVACEQVRAYDLDKRNAHYIEHASEEFSHKLTECLRSFY